MHPIKFGQIAEQPVELQALRTSILWFHQNIKLIYNKLFLASSKGQEQKILFEVYKPLLYKIVYAPVFGSTFTTEQMRNHLRFLSGIIKQLASRNMADDSKNVQKFSDQVYFKKIQEIGTEIKRQFVPLGLGLRFDLTDDQLLTAAPLMKNLFDRVGANLNTKFTFYVNEMAAKKAGLIEEIVKAASYFDKLVQLGIVVNSKENTTRLPNMNVLSIK